MMHLKTIALSILFAGLTLPATAGAELQPVVRNGKEYRQLPPPAVPPEKGEAPAAPSAAPSVPRAGGRSIGGSGVRAFSGKVGRNMPMPAPSRRIGEGQEYHEFYGPTYYFPSEHNVYEGLHPQYYPFIRQKGWPNYKAPADYCAGKLCGPSSSMYYWDSYDDWKRGERYEQHQ